MYTTNQSEDQQIFKDNAWKLQQRGINCIPTSGKIPIVKNWNKFITERVGELQIDSWSAQYPDKNLGVIMGKVSGIIAIDYDAVTPLKQVTDLIPRSEVERLGKKGFVRFYKYNGEENRKFNHIKVELFSDGGQVIVPPSIHPDTREPYKWTSFSTLYDIHSTSDLEPLPNDLILRLEALNEAAKAAEKSKPSKNKHTSGEGGRNNKLFEIASAGVGSNEPRVELEQKLINYDKSHHDVPWFSDTSEAHKGNVKKAVNNMIDRAVSLHEKSGEKYEPDGLGGDFNFAKLEDDAACDNVETKPKELWKSKLPEPTGMLKDLTDLCLEASHIKRPKFALASSIQLMATLLTNKLSYNGTITNIYQILVAESSEGKDAPLNFPANVLSLAGASSLAGLESYRGDSTFMNSLSDRKDRLDTIDEISILFKAMNSKGGGNHLGSIGEVLSKIWSRNNEISRGHYVQGKVSGFCFSPGISIFGATTPEAFSNSFSSINVMQGFGGRMLYYFEDEKVGKGELNHFPLKLTTDTVPDWLKVFVRFWRDFSLESKKIDVKGQSIPNPNYDASQSKNAKSYKFMNSVEVPEFLDAISVEVSKEIGATDAAKALMVEFKEKVYYELKDRCSPNIRPVVSRGLQQIVKLSIINCVSRMFNKILDGEADLQIDSEDVLWSIAYFEASVSDASRLFDETLLTNKFHADSVYIEKTIKEMGGLVFKSALTSRLRRKFKSNELYDHKNGLIPSMIAAGIITKELGEKGKNGKHPVSYKLRK